LANICFDKAYQKAIEDKPIEEQRAEQKLYEWPQTQRQAEIVAATASCTNWRKVRGHQMQEHSAEGAMLKVGLRESKVARLAARAVSSHRRKTLSGGHFHPRLKDCRREDISLENPAVWG
jgi:hypothetical protein